MSSSSIGSQLQKLSAGKKLVSNSLEAAVCSWSVHPVISQARDVKQSLKEQTASLTSDTQC